MYFKKFFFHINNKYYQLQKSIHDLKSIAVEITGRCNLQCKHCYMSAQASNFHEDVSFDEWIGFFNRLKKDFGNKIVIQITGGEPLLRTDLYEILKHLKILGFRASLATNGLSLDEKNIIELRKYISGLSISLDGFKPSHDCLRDASVFGKTVESIKNLKRQGFKDITIKTTVFKKNLRELNEFFRFIQTFEIDNWHLFAMEPAGRGRLNEKEILSQKEYGELCDFIDELKKDKKNKLKILFEEQSDIFSEEKTCDYNKYKLCYAGISSCAILYNGDITGCIQSDRTVIFGNIKNDHFKNIWYNEFKNNRSGKYKHCQNHYFNN